MLPGLAARSPPGSSTSSGSRRTCSGTSRSALLFVVAATLIVPAAGTAARTPLAPLTRRPGGDLGGGFLLGASLGLVFVAVRRAILAGVVGETAPARTRIQALRRRARLRARRARRRCSLIAPRAAGGSSGSGPRARTSARLRIALGVAIGRAALGIAFEPRHEAPDAGSPTTRASSSARSARRAATARDRLGQRRPAVDRARRPGLGPEGLRRGAGLHRHLGLAQHEPADDRRSSAARSSSSTSGRTPASTACARFRT